MSQTHFGFASVDESAKAGRVRGVFDSVAPKYDLMNDLMSLGLHRAWKAYAVAVANVRPGDRVLDIAGGTGDLARAFAKAVGRPALVVHTDINEAMLLQGRDRLLDEGIVLPTARCDAEALPFASGSFDLVSVAFGLRNMTHKDKALAEMARVLKTGGRLLVLEFSKVAAPLGEGLRLVFLQGPAPDRPMGRRRRRQLSIPGRIDPRPSRPGRAEGDDEERGLRPRRCPQPRRRRGGTARGNQMLKGRARRWRGGLSLGLSLPLLLGSGPAAAAGGLGLGAGGLTPWIGLAAALWALLGAAVMPAGCRAAPLPRRLPSSCWRARSGIRRLQRARGRSRAAAPTCQLEPKARPLCIPAGLDGDAVLDVARGRFMRLQAAWDAGDISTLKSLTTPEMLEELLHVLDRTRRRRQPH